MGLTWPSKIRWKLIPVGLVAVAIIAAAGFFICRGCGDEPAANCEAGQHAPPGWVTPPTETTPWLPFKKNKASEVTEGFPAGSKVVVVTTQGGEQVEVGILPGGEVVVPPGVTAVVYEKRRPVIEGEFRPWLGGGAEGTAGDIDPAVAAGVDLVRVWRIHAGPGAVASTDNVAAVLSAGLQIWRNVDARAGGGYGTSGATGFVGLSIGIE